MTSVAKVVPHPIRRMVHGALDAIEQRRRRHVPIPWGSWGRLRRYGDLQRVVSRVWSYTMVPGWRLANLYYLASSLDEVPGDIVECGTCNGGSAALLAHVSRHGRQQRKLHLFDSFQGLPKPGDLDGDRAPSFEGKCLGSVDRVRQALRAVDAVADQVRIVPGWFNDTFPAPEIRSIAMLHIDADFYDPVKLCLDTFYDRVQLGGYIVLDDYRYWEGCDRAAEEFLQRKGLHRSLAQLRRTRHYFQKQAN